ncbi:MAG: EamA family transporter [Gammaproteobacteria bacterium]|nr:EamA family transporter [Gammaproteobacteria bacterium]
MQVDPRRSAKLALALATVYLVWGSSFLFTKIGVSHLPPALFAGVRFTTAGLVLTLVARRWLREPWPGTVREYRLVGVCGVLMVFVSNGLSIWAMRLLPSHEVALLNSTSALWIALLGSIGRRGHPLSVTTIASLALGFSGTALMLGPAAQPHPEVLTAKFAVVTGCLAWSLGTVYYRNSGTRMAPLMFVGLQMIAGGALLLATGFATGETARWTLDLPGAVSLAYLTFVSSCFAYSAYGWLAVNTTPAVIGTYSYVNPTIATVLGWRFLHETLTRRQIGGITAVVAGLLLLTRSARGGFARRTTEPDAR